MAWAVHQLRGLSTGCQGSYTWSSSCIPGQRSFTCMPRLYTQVRCHSPACQGCTPRSEVINSWWPRLHTRLEVIHSWWPRRYTRSEVIHLVARAVCTLGQRSFNGFVGLYTRSEVIHRVGRVGPLIRDH